MALRIHLLLHKSFYVPEERVACTVQVYNDATDSAVAAQLKDLHFSSIGVERTDTHWIKHLHRSGAPEEPSSEPRKRIRNVYKTVSVPLLQDAAISAGSAHQFHVRFRLPASLPPTFKGQSCRFSYVLEVKAIYSQQLPGSIAPSSYETIATTNFTVWPPPSPSRDLLRSCASQQPLGTPLRSYPSNQQPPLGQQVPFLPQQNQTRPPSAYGSEAPSYWAPSEDRSARSSATGEPSLPFGGAGTPFGTQSTAMQQPATDGTTWPPVIDYPLRQNIKVKWKEVAVDYSMLQRQLSATVPPLHPPESPANTLPPSPTPSASTASLAGSVAPLPHQHHHYDPSHSHPPHPVRRAANPTSPRSVTTTPTPASPRATEALHHRLSGSTSGGVIEPSAEPVSPEVASAAAALAQYKVGAKLAAATRSQLLGRRGSSAAADLGQSDSSSSSWSSGEDMGDEGSAADAVQRRAESRRRGNSSSAGGAPSLQSARSMAEAALRAMPPSVFGHVYSLQLREHTILRIVLQAPLDSALQPGASFGGLVELRPGGLITPPAMLCHQLTVLLESEEVVPAELSARGGGRRPGVMRRLHCEHQEITSDVAVTHFLFSIPAGATPSFETPMVSLRWVLRFELTIGPPLPLLGAVSPPSAKSMPAAEQMLWSLPLHVQTPSFQEEGR